MAEILAFRSAPPPDPARSQCLFETAPRLGNMLDFVRVGYTNDHEPLAYYTNTATEGAYVAAIDTDDGSLALLDVSIRRDIELA